MCTISETAFLVYTFNIEELWYSPRLRLVLPVYVYFLEPLYGNATEPRHLAKISLYSVYLNVY